MSILGTPAQPTTQGNLQRAFRDLLRAECPSLSAQECARLSRIIAAASPRDLRFVRWPHAAGVLERAGEVVPQRR